MIHRIDKEAVKRIVYLRQVQGLSFPTIAERFGISSARTVQIFKRQQKKQQSSTSSLKIYTYEYKSVHMPQTSNIMICKKHDA